ncbi:MAG: hypothetical protein LBV60_23425 [Streptomyces sp.]|nr:hypothetical protein [Streptomyces sp.]
MDVSDPVRAFLEPDHERLGSERGRGLLVVAQLAEDLDWFLRAEIGKTVRARLGVAGPS